MSKMLAGVTTTIQDLLFRVSQVKEKFGDSHNDLVDSYNDHDTEIHKINA